MIECLTNFPRQFWAQNLEVEKIYRSEKKIRIENENFSWRKMILKILKSKKSRKFRLFFDFKISKIIFLQDFFFVFDSDFFSDLEFFSTSRICAQNCLGKFVRHSIKKSIQVFHYLNKPFEFWMVTYWNAMRWFMLFPSSSLFPMFWKQVRTFSFLISFTF